MITAEQARQLAGPSVEEYVERLGLCIEQAAKDGQRQLRIGIDSNLDCNFWAKGHTQHYDWLAAKKMLEELGYTVSFKYDTVYYTLVEW